MNKLFQKYIKSIVTLMAVLLLMSCKIVVPETKIDDENIPFQVLITISHSNFTDQKNLIVDSSEGLDEIFATINSTRKPGIPVPKVDFQKENVAVINIGERATGGHSVLVKEIIEQEDKIVIYYEENGPKAGENATMVITSPFTMFKFQKQTKPIMIERILN